MATNNEFTQYCVDMLSEHTTIKTRSMFGGIGIYAEGVMIGFTDDEKLYIKTDDQNRQRFIDMGSGPFMYTGRKDGKPIAMSYYELPIDTLENHDLCGEIVHEVIEVAMKAAAAKAKKKKKD